MADVSLLVLDRPRSAAAQNQPNEANPQPLAAPAESPPFAAPAKTPPPAKKRERLKLDDEFEANFTDSKNRGIGVRFQHLLTDSYLDLRLKGEPGVDPEVSGKSREFRSASGLKVVYEPRGNQVKETIVLERRAPSEFRFAIKTKDLTPRVEAGEIVFASPSHPALFRLQPPTAFDADGVEIPATLELGEGGSEVVLRLDEATLANARLPIVIDPTIEGALSGSTPGAHARKIFQTSDGRLIFFHRRSDSGATKLAYVVSADAGETWGAPVDIATVPATSEVSAAQLTESGQDTFFISYSTSDAGGSYIAFRTLTPQGASWTIGAESRVSGAASGPLASPAPAVLDRGSGPLGRRLAVGYTTFTSVGAVTRYDYVVSFSEDGGLTWLTTSVCASDSWRGTLARQGDRTLCVTSPLTHQDLKWREWGGAVWNDPKTLVVGVLDEMASTLSSPDATLHLVSGNGTVRYASLAPGAADFTVPVDVGIGTNPVISLTEGTLSVFAAEPVYTRESQLRSYASRDGITWLAGPPSGRPFPHVLDYNAAWNFESFPGDALFGLSDSLGTVGNVVGTKRFDHRLDNPDEKLDFRFTAPASGGTVSKVELWATSSNNAPKYRIGLQTDCGCTPVQGPSHASGTWANEVRVGGVLVGGSFEEVSFQTGVDDLVEIDFGEVTATANGVYHVVVEPVPDPTGLIGPATTRWSQFQAVGALQLIEGDADRLGVFDGTATVTSTSWAWKEDRAGRFVVSGSGGVVASQKTLPGVDRAATEYAVTGESFVAPRAIAPTTARLYLEKQGNPTTPVTLRLIDTAGENLWSHQVTPTATGWITAPVSGVSLQMGTRYRFLADSTNRDYQNYWLVGVSGDASASWDGATSIVALAYDRPGFNERGAEAADFRSWPKDLVPFNSSADDMLYLGDSNPFDFIQLTRLSSNPGTAVGTKLEYWNGGSWVTLTTSSNTLGASSGGDVIFDAPQDWVQTKVNETVAWWVRVVPTSGVPANLFVDRTTAIPNIVSPSSPPSSPTFVPVATQSQNAPAGIAVELHFQDPVKVSVDSLGRHADGTSERPAVAAGGRYVAFSSEATNLAGFVGCGPQINRGSAQCSQDTNEKSDIFVRDLALGTTVRVSVGSGGEANDHSYRPSLSANGRFVAFHSHATNLVPGDTNVTADVFVHDRDSDADGVFDEIGGTSTSRVSLSSTEAQATGSSQRPVISADGNLVAFLSWAQDLAAGDAVWPQAYLRNRTAGTTERVSIPDAASSSTYANGAVGGDLAMSPNGRHVVFTSSAANLDPNVSVVSVESRVYARDRLRNSTRLVSRPLSGPAASLKSSGAGLSVSSDGRFVAFAALAADVVQARGNFSTIYVRDRNTDNDDYFDEAGASTTIAVSPPPASGLPVTEGKSPTISLDGRFVAFHTTQPLDPRDLNVFEDVYVYDRDLDADGTFDEVGAISTTRVSTGMGGLGGGAFFGQGASINPTISADGRYIAFDSDAFFLTDLYTKIPSAALPFQSPDPPFRLVRDVFLADRDPARGCADPGSTWTPEGCTAAGSFARAASNAHGLEDFYPYRQWNVGSNGAAFANLATGNLVVQYTDLDIPGQGLGLRLTRTFNSQLLDGPPGPLGRGWTLGISDGESDELLAGLLSAATTLDLETAATIVGSEDAFDFRDADGTRHHFVKGLADGVWKSPPGISLVVRDFIDANGKLAYRLIRPDGVAYVFGQQGQDMRLLRIEDRKENVLSVSYNTDGTLKDVADLAGRKVVFGWVSDPDGLKFLDKAEFQVGAQVLTVRYVVDQTSHLLTSATEAFGTADARTTAFGHNQSDCTIICVTDARAKMTKFQGPEGRLGTVVDRAGSSWIVTYGAGCVAPVGRDNIAGCVRDPEGNTATWTISPQVNLVHYRDEGDVDEAGAPRLNSRSYEWAGNRVARETDEAGNAVEYSYNSLGQITESRVFGVPEPTLVNRFTYTNATTSEGAVAFLTEARLAAGDPQHERRWTFAYDVGGKGQLEVVEDPITVGDGNVVNTRYEYHPRGLLKKVTDARGKSTSYGDALAGDYGYDPSGQPKKITDPTPKSKILTYDFLGRLTNVVDRESQTWDYAYDLRGNLLSEKIPPGTNGVATDRPTTIHCYDLNDNELLTIRPKKQLTACPANPGAVNIWDYPYSVRKAYDDRDLLTESLTVSDAKLRKTLYFYESDGELGRILEPRSFNNAGTQVATQEAKYLRYPNNRVKAFIDEEGAQTDLVYTPNALIRRVSEPPNAFLPNTTTPDPTKRVQRTYTYNGRGQVLTALESGHASPTSYAYNPHGEKISEKTPAGRETLMSYDKMGRLFDLTQPTGRVIKRRYDEAGNLKTITQPTGSGTAEITTSYTHTDRNEIATETDPGDTNRTIRYTYDGEGRQKKREDLYQGAAGAVRLIEQEYYQNGRQKEKRSTGLDGAHRVAFEYDLNGNVSRMVTYDSGSASPNVSTVDYSYTGADETRTTSETLYYSVPASITVANTLSYLPDGLLASRNVNNVTTSYDYRLNGVEKTTTLYDAGKFASISFPNGALSRTDLPNGSFLTQTYDLADRLSSKIVRRSVSDATKLSSWEAIAYDEDDNRTAELAEQKQPDHSVLSGGGTYTYNLLSHLATAKHPFEPSKVVDFDPDHAGNARKDDSFTFTYSNNRVTSRVSVSQGGPTFDYVFDKVGNQKQEQKRGTSEVTATVHWASGHPKQVTPPDSSKVFYVYDGLDRLTRRDVINPDNTVNEVTFFFHDPSAGQAVLERNPAGDKETRYYLDSDGTPVAQEVLNPTKRSYYVTDPRDNVTQLIDSSRDSVAVFGYDPYGKDKPNLTKTTSGWDSRLRFQTAPRDPKTGAYNIGQRLYDPNINRFVGSDFYVAAAANLELQLDPLTGNSYIYAGCNPTNFIDDGHKKKKKKKGKKKGTEGALTVSGDLEAEKVNCPGWLTKVSRGLGYGDYIRGAYHGFSGDPDRAWELLVGAHPSRLLGLQAQATRMVAAKMGKRLAARISGFIAGPLGAGASIVDAVCTGLAGRPGKPMTVAL